MKITVLGAGAWGTALAVAAASDVGAPHTVRLWARDAAQAARLQAERQNARYLPGLPLPERLTVFSTALADLPAAIQGDDLLVVGTPMAALRGMLTALREVAMPVAWLCKGFERADAGAVGLLGHEVCAQVAPGVRAGVLSGPSFAQEVARGAPTALVAASRDPEVCRLLVQAFHSPALRVYANDDVVGVEVGGAVKNVMAIATGLCDGLGLGLNARAALITRGLAEMSRLGLALGAKLETFMGLSGLGDLVLTATGDLSRNRQVGLLLAQGQTLQQAVDSLGHVAEGVYSARTVAQRARSLGVEMPITEAVVALLDGGLTPAQALTRLMGRDPVAEIH
ncbi:NAD(P)H-dependent glycerol-3-phosphate dehydrogenase [Macromonas nakdongensis]|uniref:NAD(P)H-dependent glycerol-3-phosphate dehydrogenase n=1 Tax=Macromonas nakdongensis TaxID=1843082 RepID=UPI000C3307A2|nr:NAD(P)H-dependent glycerol-3-phosphate dehydrogenase [Macromonas nakdongensis]